MRAYFVTLCVALASCATPIQPTTIVESPKPLPPVQVPIIVPCVSADQIEPVPPSAMPRSTNIAELANGAAVDAVTYRLLAQRQNEILKACAKAQGATK